MIGGFTHARIVGGPIPMEKPTDALTVHVQKEDQGKLFNNLITYFILIKPSLYLCITLNNIYGCTHRYKLSVNATDIEPNEQNKTILAQLMFFGDHGVTLTGKDAILVVATTRGRVAFYS